MAAAEDMSVENPFETTDEEVDMMVANMMRAATISQSAAAVAALCFCDVEAKELEIKGRKSYPRVDFTESTWFRMLRDDAPELMDDASRKGKLFRRRFAVPCRMYVDFVEKAKVWFPIKPKDAFGRPSVPVELKVLGSLRVLGKGYHFDGIAELSGMSEPTMQAWHHKFLERFVGELMSVWVKYPKTAEEAAPYLKVYKRLGVPGGAACSDCTHLAWGCCPAALTNDFAGKEGYPTVAYSLTCEHHRKILHVTSGHPGARNDKTIIRFDEFMMGVHEGTFLSDVEFELLDEDGNPYTERGAFVITDGGYHLWRCCQCPIKLSRDPDEMAWSVRLDRCRHKIDNTFFACCIIHNMLLSYDGMDTCWEEDENWVREDGDDDDILVGLQELRARLRLDTANLTCADSGLDFSFTSPPSLNTHDMEVLPDFFELQRKLVVNHAQMKKANARAWTRRGK